MLGAFQRRRHDGAESGAAESASTRISVAAVRGGEPASRRFVVLSSAKRAGERASDVGRNKFEFGGIESQMKKPLAGFSFVRRAGFEPA